MYFLPTAPSESTTVEYGAVGRHTNSAPRDWVHRDKSEGAIMFWRCCGGGERGEEGGGKGGREGGEGEGEEGLESCENSRKLCDHKRRKNCQRVRHMFSLELNMIKICTYKTAYSFSSSL